MRILRACTCRRVRGLIFSPFYQNQNFMGFCQKNHKDPSYLLKMALYWPQGSGTLRQQLLMMHGIAWHCMVLHCIAWYCMVLHYIAWYCRVLHGIALSCNILHYIALSCTILHYLAVIPYCIHIMKDIHVGIHVGIHVASR